MRCLPVSKVPLCRGNCLHDWHAEIVALRAFNYYILSQCLILAQDATVTSDVIQRRVTTDEQGSSSTNNIPSWRRSKPQQYAGHWSRDLETSLKLFVGGPAYYSVSERHRRDHIPGFPDLARFMGDGDGPAVFRRFGALNARILLYLQAEILELEYELDAVERDEAQKDNETFNGTAWLRGKFATEGSSAHALYEIVTELQQKLEKYNALLLQHKELFNLRHAKRRNVIEQIFGFLKARFEILNHAPQYSMTIQSFIPPVLASLHNFIMKHNAQNQAEVLSDRDASDPFPGLLRNAGNLASATVCRAEKECADAFREFYQNW